MKKMDKILIFVISICLLRLSYFLIFKTDKYLAYVVKVSNYKKDSFIHNSITNKRNILWLKITGSGLALISIIVMIILIINVN